MNNIYNIVVDNLKLQMEFEMEVKAEMHIKEDLAIPSIKLVMFLTAVTSQLDISIMDFSDYELLRLKTVQDITDLLTSKLQDSYENE
jgi:acyl carrier protein